MLHSFGGNSFLLKLGAGQGHGTHLQVEETSAKAGRMSPSFAPAERRRCTCER